MGYKNVKEFINNNEHEMVRYNFDLENDVEWYAELKDFERYFTYKATVKESVDSVYEYGKKFAEKVHNMSDVNKIVDCDGSGGQKGSELIHEIYFKLWNWKTDSGTFGDIANNIFNCKFGAETYNSAQTTLNRVIQKNSDENPDFKPRKPNKFSINFIIELFNNPKTNKNFKSELLKHGYLAEYLNFYHTIGNFGLVPSGFNKWRGTSGKVDEIMINDYLDLSLLYLKKYGWEEKFNFNGGTINDFYRFINYFFLWDYISDNGDVKMISNEDEEYFSNLTTKFIIRRSYFMCALLKIEELIGSDNYQKIRKSIFEVDSYIYNNYTQVIEKIYQLLQEIVNDCELLDNLTVILNDLIENIEHIKIDKSVEENGDNVLKEETTKKKNCKEGEKEEK